MEAGVAENPFNEPEGYQQFVRAEEVKFAAQIMRERAEL